MGNCCILISLWWFLLDIHRINSFTGVNTPSNSIKSNRGLEFIWTYLSCLLVLKSWINWLKTTLWRGHRLLSFTNSFWHNFNIIHLDIQGVPRKRLASLWKYLNIDLSLSSHGVSDDILHVGLIWFLFKSPI